MKRAEHSRRQVIEPRGGRPVEGAFKWSESERRVAVHPSSRTAGRWMQRAGKAPHLSRACLTFVAAVVAGTAAAGAGRLRSPPARPGGALDPGWATLGAASFGSDIGAPGAGATPVERGEPTRRWRRDREIAVSGERAASECDLRHKVGVSFHFRGIDGWETDASPRAGLKPVQGRWEWHGRGRRKPLKAPSVAKK